MSSSLAWAAERICGQRSSRQTVRTTTSPVPLLVSPPGFEPSGEGVPEGEEEEVPFVEAEAVDLGRLVRD